MRALIIGTCIWALGVAMYSLSFFIHILQDAELQANLVLALSLVPLAWTGSKIYYRSGRKLPGIHLGLIMVGAAIVLDALVTVPFLVVPNGGTYDSFFTASSFWLIAGEYLLVVLGYWYIKIK